jgi:type IV secretion system protein VirB4
LIKQGGAGVVASLDLSGFDEELTVLSGRTATVRRLDDLLKAGVDEAVALPRLLAAPFAA